MEGEELSFRHQALRYLSWSGSSPTLSAQSREADTDVPTSSGHLSSSWLRMLDTSCEFHV